MSREAKLVELHRKTDRELRILAQRELDRGLALAGVAASRQSPLLARAERIYQTVGSLLPGICGLSREERRELKVKLKDLQAAIGRLQSEPACRSMAGTAAD
jgi:hypothetical protein